MPVVKRQMPPGRGKQKKGAVVEVAPVTDLSLPTERTVPSNRLQDYSMLLFGRPKIGKTDLTSHFPDTFHLMTEPGGKALSLFQRPVTNWREFTGYVRLLEKDKRFRTVAVDTVDMAYKFCFDHMTQKLGVDHPSEEAYGKGWAAIRDEFVRWMTRLMASGKGVILVSHDVERKIKQRGGMEYDRIVPTLSGQGRDIVEPMVDLFFYYQYDGDDRVLTIVGDEHIAAGHRLGRNFRYPDGTPIKEIPMGRSAAEAHQNLVAAFQNKLPKPRSEEPAPIKKKLKLPRRS